MQRTAEVIRLVVGRRSTVLITGGTGKEMVERAIALSGEREILDYSDFDLAASPAAFEPPSAATASVSSELALPENGLDFKETVGSIGRQILEHAMRKSGGNKTAAAEMLGLKRTTLAAKLKSLGASASL